MTKRFIKKLILFLLLFVMLVINRHDALGFSDDHMGIGNARGKWIWNDENAVGAEISRDKLILPGTLSPHLFSRGLMISAPTTICHPFSSGQFGWIGEIYQFNSGAWEKVDTTLGWVPDAEGRFMACAYAHSAGIYALFGYYQEPKVKEKCTSNIYIDSLDTFDSGDGGFLFYGSISPAKEHVLIRYRFSHILPSSGYISGAAFASTYTNKNGEFRFSDPFKFEDGLIDFDFNLYIGDCNARKNNY